MRKWDMVSDESMNGENVKLKYVLSLQAIICLVESSSLISRISQTRQDCFSY